MDKVTRYRNAIRQELESRAQRRASNMPLVHRVFLEDEKNMHFLLLSVGWNGAKYVHQCLIHIQIIGEKIWIHQDLTDPGMMDALTGQGILADDFVPGYISERERVEHSVSLPAFV